MIFFISTKMGDVISLWNYGEAELRGFLDHLNTYDQNSQFTLEVEIEINNRFYSTWYLPSEIMIANPVGLSVPVLLV